MAIEATVVETTAEMIVAIVDVDQEVREEIVVHDHQEMIAAKVEMIVVTINLRPSEERVIEIDGTTDVIRRSAVEVQAEAHAQERTTTLTVRRPVTQKTIEKAAKLLGSEKTEYVCD